MQHGSIAGDPEMSHLDLNNLDRESWPVYRFDQIARSIGERVDPTTTDLETYIGLEHLDPESIHIRRFGKRDDVSGSKLRCYPGDVIFGRRRAYQRKAAVVEIDAFCSAHSLVLRAIPEVILPELFPFFLHSDSFMHRAVDISVGSLSPTINWKTLREQEFRLPPLCQQQGLVELFVHGDKQTVSQAEIRQCLRMLKQSQLRAAFDRSDCEKIKLGDISKNLDTARKPVKKSDRTAGRIPYYGASGIVDFVDGWTHDQPILLVSEDGENLQTRKLPIAYEVDGKCWVNNHAHALAVEAGLRFLVAEYLNSTDLGDFISGTTRPKITKATLDSLPIYLPKPNQRSAVEIELKSTDFSLQALESAYADSSAFNKALINTVF